MATEQTEIGELIDSRGLSLLQIWVIVICGLVVLLDGYDIQTMALAVPSLIKEWGLERPAFAIALSASLAGMFVGASLVGPFGDRQGRKPVMIVGLVIVGASSIATATAGGSHLVSCPGFAAGPAITASSIMCSRIDVEVWRLLTGLGLGMSLPNAVALTSEYVPHKQRAWLISLMYCTVAIGALVAGFVAPALIASHGWKSIFYVGGVLPLVLTLLLLVSVPESLRFLLARRPDDPRIGRLLARLAKGVDPQTVYVSESDKTKGQSVATLFSQGLAGRTILLWLLFIFNLFVLYTLISWLPAILHDAGWSPGDASRGSVMIQAGGVVGGLTIAFCVDRGRTVTGLFVGYVLAAIGFAAFLVVAPTVLNWEILLLVIGAGVSGGQLAFTALAAMFYPTTVRSTGTGWAFAMGRFGAIAGPILLTQVTAHFHLKPVEQLVALIPLILLCAITVLLVPLVWKNR